VRTPKILELLREYYKIEIGQHINGDDSPALGASFIAANYTAGVRVKPLVFTDGPNYEVKLNINQGEKPLVENQTLFPYKTNYGSKNHL
jgi:hypothetical protein